MLRLRRVEIENFVLFERLVVEPSVDPERRLTVIRAENGSGKTTFLRALKWGMYGEKGLPGRRERYSVHPAWWVPDEEGVETRVAIEFETDGSTRHHESGGDSRVYRLERSVRTVKSQGDTPHGDDFVRISERKILMEQDLTGRWHPHDSGVDIVVDELLPWQLRDFFLMDADDVTDFAGGTESKVVSPEEVERMTTDAVRSLLGIEVFEKASDRVRRIARELRKKATKAVGDRDLDVLQAEQNTLESEREELGTRLEQDRKSKAELVGQLRRCREKLEAALQRAGSYEDLVAGREAAEARGRMAETARESAQAQLAGGLEQSALLAVLMKDSLATVSSALKPLYDDGRIPVRHVGYVRRLLDVGTCVCGQDLFTDPVRRQRVQEQLAQSEREEGAASHLGELYEASVGYLSLADESVWLSEQADAERRLAAANTDLAAARLDVRDLKSKLDGIDHDEVLSYRDEEASLESQIGMVDRSIGRHELELDTVVKRLDAVSKRVRARQRSEVAAEDSRVAAENAELAADVLRDSYRAIQEEQVGDLSRRMGALFRQMAANVGEEDTDGEGGGKTSIRMIREVGVRPLEGSQDRFEIFALNPRGRSMPPTEINGASRRVIALSFVLALCKESRTRAPLVADSLLNSMSGSVRRNTLIVTVRNSEQPILLLTSADLESPTEAATVAEVGGAVYTMTAPDAGDLMHHKGDARGSRLCPCGPREYCEVCERTGQAAAAGWRRRTS